MIFVFYVSKSILFVKLCCCVVTASVHFVHLVFEVKRLKSNLPIGGMNTFIEKQQFYCCSTSPRLLTILFTLEWKAPKGRRTTGRGGAKRDPCIKIQSTIQALKGRQNAKGDATGDNADNTFFLSEQVEIVFFRKFAF